MDFDPTMAIGWFVIFIFSATVHEGAHSWIAKLGGDQTAYIGGQVSLNPVPHIRREPFGMIVLPVITVIMMGWPIGYASAPYDPKWALSFPRRAALMALAGPASNLLVAFLSVALMWWGINNGTFDPALSHITSIVSAGKDSEAHGAAMLLSMLLTMNFLLFVLNIIPLPPLDGSNVLMLFMKQETAIKYYEFVNHPVLAMIGIFIMFNIIGFIFWPLYGWFLHTVM